MKKIKENRPFMIMDKVRNRIDIHPEFKIVFQFLIQIEAEVNELMGYEKRLKDIKRQCKELVDLMAKMNPPDDLNFTLSENPETLAAKFYYVRPVRSELIVQFAHLETLRCLYMAYQKKTSENDELRDASDGAIDEFIKEFCLCKNNQWVIENPKRAGKISASSLRALRNSLTHFFSLNKIGLVPLYDEVIEKIGNQMNNKVQIISPEDFENILHHAARLMLEKWSDDCKKSLDNSDGNFIERMRCVKEVVEKNGAVFVYENNVSKK